MSRLKILALTAVIALIVLLVVPAVATAQQLPPCRVQGTVALDGKTAPDGTTVTASIEGTQVATGTVASGKYKVQFDLGTYSGKTITFKVGTAAANETAVATNGLVTLNLTATSGVGPTPTPTPTPSQTPTAQPTPIPGPKGDKGDTGAAGPAGPKGDTGATGPAGSAGSDGADGDDASSALGIVALIIAIVALIVAAFVMLRKKAA